MHALAPLSASQKAGSRPVLKHLYHRNWLNFTAGILAVEEDYTIEGPVTESAVQELLKAGKVSELHELYTNWAIDLD